MNSGPNVHTGSLLISLVMMIWIACTLHRNRRLLLVADFSRRPERADADAADCPLQTREQASRRIAGIDASVIRVLAITVAIYFPISAASGADNWAQFRGPNSQGILDHAKPPVQFGLEKALRWKTPLSPGVSSPCVWDDRIFVTSFDPGRKQLETVCLDAKSGKVLWRRDAPAQELEKVHESSSPANTSPTTDGVRVYVFFPMFGVVAYRLDGSVAWTQSLPPSKMFFGYGSSPILVEGKLIVRVSAESRMLALRCEDGQTIWKSDRNDFGWGYATPVTWIEHGRTVLGIRGTGRFDVIDAGTGRTLWQIQDTALTACATPAVGDEAIFLSGTGAFGNRENLMKPPEFEELIGRYDSNKDGRIALNELPESILLFDRGISSGLGNKAWKNELTDGPEGAKRSFDKAEWTKITTEVFNTYQGSDITKTAAFAVRKGGQGDATRNILWSEIKGVPEVPSPLFYRGRVYYIKTGGILTCRDPATGKALYDERVGAEGGYFASPVAADGKIYVASDRGVITVVQSGDTFKVLSRNDLKEPIIATPALGSDALYVRGARHFWTFRSESVGER